MEMEDYNDGLRSGVGSDDIEFSSEIEYIPLNDYLYDLPWTYVASNGMVALENYKNAIGLFHCKL